MIEINYIATGGYVQYFELFKQTIHNFFPSEKKILRVITDGVVNFDGLCDDIVESTSYKMFDLIYPCINLNKTYLLSQLPRTNAEYVFYFDADTFFNEKSEEFWEEFMETLNSGSFCIGKHPFYSLSDEDEYKHRDIENFFSHMTERDNTQGSYIDSYYYTYIISSFFCAKNEVFYSVCDTVTSMIRQDMTRCNGYKIPIYMDENYFNRLVYDFEYNGDPKIKFDVRDYILLGNSVSKPDVYNAFITQKNFNNSFKLNRR